MVNNNNSRKCLLNCGNFLYTMIKTIWNYVREKEMEYVNMLDEIQKRDNLYKYYIFGTNNR